MKTPSPAKSQRKAARQRNPRLPEITKKQDEPFRLTFGRIVDVCLIPACIPLLVDRKTGEAFDGLEKRGYFFAGTLMSLLMAGVLAVAGVGVGAATWGVLKSMAIVAAKLNRRKYLPREKEKRRQLARERRAIRRHHTLNPAPTAEGLLKAWAHVRESPSNMINFGSMLCDLEAYVDNSLIHDETGEICGRRPGIRGWLNDNCPELAAKYKTVMSYKAMANKFRQAIGLEDPYPAAIALDLVEAKSIDKNTMHRHDCVEEAVGAAAAETEIAQETDVYRTTKAVAGWGREARQNMVRRAMAFLEDCGKSKRSVAAAIDARVHPDAIPRIVEIAERREQGLPDKNGLAIRLTKIMA